MKVFVLTEIGCTNSPTGVHVFTKHKEANEMMQKMYAAALEKYGVPESDANNSFVEGSFAVIGHVGYYLDIFDGEWAVDDELEVLQEMTTVVEHCWREDLMDGTIRSMSRDQVWALVRKWAEEYNERYAGFDYCANGTTLLESVEAYVDAMIEDLQSPYSQIAKCERCQELMIEVSDARVFGTEKGVSFLVICHDGYAEGDGIRLEYPKLADLTPFELTEIDDHIGGRILDSGCVTFDDVCLKYGKVVSFDGIMNDTGGHEPEMVRRINIAWLEKKPKFKPILCALYERDIDEITDADSFLYDQWKAWPEYDHGCETKDWGPYNKRALEAMVADWEFFAENYLMHVADGKDLQCVLDFVRG
ncbi:MAG: hypothetical protein J6Y20_04850 [Lachnospiraceae bacterium]|nr:hypothetical protein [Lachnospiraceae bacterium]